MEELPIYYWGAPGSGRSTSIQSVLSDKPIVLGDRKYYVQLSSRRLSLEYSSVASKFFYAAADVGRPQAVIPALERLCKAIGIVFVVDSQQLRLVHNVGALARLREDLRRGGRDLDEIPLVFQLNKRDLSELAPNEVLRSALHSGRCSYVDSVASRGEGTRETLEYLVGMI
jgi:hypothetical protein